MSLDTDINKPALHLKAHRDLPHRDTVADRGEHRQEGSTLHIFQPSIRCHQLLRCVGAHLAAVIDPHC